MTAPHYPATLEAATWSAQMAPHKVALAKPRLKVDLGDTLKSLQRAHAAVDWDLFGCEGLASAEDAVQRQADLDAEPGLLDGDHVSANAIFVALFDAEAARLGLKAQSR